VAQLVRDLSEWIGSRFGACTVRGEISGFSRAASGHCYFSLKDADGAPVLMRCAMFRRAAALLAFAPADGQLVQVRGRVAVYEPRGELQFVAEAMQRDGEGTLYEQFVQTKARLQALGLFDPARKRALPPFPAALGIVTSTAGAALHDVLTTLARRAPHVRVVVYPSAVQGADAPAALAAAIALAGMRREVDVLIVCRGGGSLEDLWAFNDERVVRAIVDAPMPVVCGVGHETDVSLCDFAADLRAPTPTAAAELAAPPRAECLDRLGALDAALRQRLQARLDAAAQRLDRAGLRLSRPDQGLRAQAQRLALLAHRLEGVPSRIVQARAASLESLGGGFQRAVSAALDRARHRAAALEGRLHALDPQRVLARGYAFLDDGRGRAVSSVGEVGVGTTLQAVLHDGVLGVAVTSVARRTTG
jgi:exodeoxyribonuclease VII large subunit